MTLLGPVEERARKTFTGGNAHHLASLLLNLGKARAGLAKDAIDFAAAEVNLVEAHTIYREAPGATPTDIRACAEALIATYTAWDEAEPGKGYGEKAAHWRAQLEAAK